ILVEGPSKRNPARMMGRSRCNKIVVFEGSSRHRGQVMDVQIERAGAFTLYGNPAVVGFENQSEGGHANSPFSPALVSSPA
ncbi:MAG TPA: TRAM domain-containing protein, partial [Verrucomicrobiae bacterium]|nr:TRAM domain-containing protein [Verrucomicrobiae bacterium]